MWGILLDYMLLAPLKRITPTHVGNTASYRLSRPCHQGSPPLMWGILSARKTVPRAYRITPTHVGNTKRGGLH